MAAPNVVHLDDRNFEAEVLQATTPVLVDFWAEWCGPCQLLGPTIDELAADYAGRVKVAKLDIDSAQTTAARFGVQSIPTVIVFHNGQAADRVVGLRSKAEYQKLLDAKLGTM